MRLNFLFGPMSTGSRPFDFTRLEDDPRGMTGTDNSFLGYARALSDRGHEVTIFAARQRYRTEWGAIKVRPYEERRAIAPDSDAILTWNDTSGLADVPSKPLRVLNTQVNDYSYTRPEEHERIDLYIAPSAALGRRLAAEAATIVPKPSPWAVAPNGCDPSAYDMTAKAPGRCIFASSPDRGLHVVLENWLRIRERVPNATLRIFYHALPIWFEQIAANSMSPRWNEREHARRATIVRDLLPTLESHGVEVVGSVSRRQMAREYSEAMCLAFPTDTISFTEGFGVAALEGCASGAIPCITSCDAFGEVYAGAAPIVSVPEGCRRFANNPHLAAAWVDNVVRALTPGEWRDSWVNMGRSFAESHAWPVLAAGLEATLMQGIERKHGN